MPHWRFDYAKTGHHIRDLDRSIPVTSHQGSRPVTNPESKGSLEVRVVNTSICCFVGPNLIQPIDLGSGYSVIRWLCGLSGLRARAPSVQNRGEKLKSCKTWSCAKTRRKGRMHAMDTRNWTCHVNRLLNLLSLGTRTSLIHMQH